MVPGNYIERDGWFVLQGERPGVSARELARSYGLEELRDFIEHCRQICDHRRGWVLPEGSIRNRRRSRRCASSGVIPSENALRWWSFTVKIPCAQIRNDRTLGMNVRICRRDFLNSVLLASGSAL